MSFPIIISAKHIVGAPHCPIQTTFCGRFSILKCIGLIALILVIVTGSGQAEGAPRAGEDSYGPVGLMAFLTGTGDTTKLHLIRLGNDTIDKLFTAEILETVQAPICFTNSVILASSDGFIRKFTLQGDRLFKAKPENFDGAAGYVGKIDEGRIFITETIWDPQKKGWRYKVHFVVVSGDAPVVSETHEIIQPFRIVRTGTEIIVIGEKKTERLNVKRK